MITLAVRALRWLGDRLWRAGRVRAALRVLDWSCRLEEWLEEGGPL